MFYKKYDARFTKQSNYFYIYIETHENYSGEICHYVSSSHKPGRYSKRN